jgi:SPP1 family predicted phage head-tail adaptor
MQAGKMRKRFTVQQRSRVPNELGEEADVYTDMLQTWGSLEPLTGREQFAAEAVQAELTHRIRIRYQAVYKPTPRDRMVIPTENRTFNVHSVANVEEKNFEYEIVASEYPDGG